MYSVIFSNGKKSIGIGFDRNGLIKYKSSMLLDEEEEANRIALKNKICNLKYSILSFNKKNILRCEIQKKEFIIKELRRIYINKEYEKLKYIYYELNNKVICDNNFMYSSLINSIDENISKYNSLLTCLNNK